MRHHAGWHKTCHLKFNQTKLKRLQKITKEKISSSVVHTHSSHDIKEDDKCFLCERPAESEGLHNVSTYDVDTALLAKLVNLGT